MIQKLSIFVMISILLVGCSKKEAIVQKVNSDNHFKLTYSVSIPELKNNLGSLEILIPVPQTNDYQTVHDVSIETNGSYTIKREEEYKNKYASILFSDSLSELPSVKMTIDVTREENNNFVKKEIVTVEQRNVLDRFLMADSLVPIGGQMIEEANKITNDSMDVVQKMKAIYVYLFETMKYDKSGEGWGRGDALYACDIRKGNCTDFHSLFIGMARSLGVPSRFLIGFPLSPTKSESTIGGYHCWAEFYLENHGWVPVDISEAAKDSTRKDYLFGNLDFDRVTFSVGRDIKVETAHGVESLNFFIYPQVFINGESYNNYVKEFSFKKLN